MTNILYAVFAGICFSVMGLGYKLAERRGCRSLSFAIAFSFAGMMIAAVSPGQGETDWGDLRLWGLGTGMGAALFFALSALMVANRMVPPSISWTLLNLSLLVPILPAPLLFHEPFTRLDPLILLCFILMLFSFARGNRPERAEAAVAPPVHGRMGGRALLLLSLLFLTNGLFNLGNKGKNLFFGDENSHALAMIFFATCGLISLVITLFRRTRPIVNRQEVMVGLFTGGCSSTGSIFFLRAMELPASTVFPVTCGLSLLGGVALTTLFFGEKMNRWKILGIFLGMVSLIGAVMR